MQLQWNFCNPIPECSDFLWHPTKIYGTKVFLLIKIKPQYSGILYNQIHFPGSLVCRIRQVPLHRVFWFWCVLDFRNKITKCSGFGVRFKTSNSITICSDFDLLIDWFMVSNATFNNISAISWRSVLLVEEAGVPGENHRPVANHWQTLSNNVVSSTPRHERGSNSQL